MSSKDFTVFSLPSFFEKYDRIFLIRSCLRLPRAECLFKDEETEAGSSYKASSA